MNIALFPYEIKRVHFYKFIYFVKNSHLPFTKINKCVINKLLLNFSIKFHANKIGNRHGYECFN